FVEVVVAVPLRVTDTPDRGVPWSLVTFPVIVRCCANAGPATRTSANNVSNDRFISTRLLVKVFSIRLFTTAQDSVEEERRSYPRGSNRQAPAGSATTPVLKDGMSPSGLASSPSRRFSARSNGTSPQFPYRRHRRRILESRQIAEVRLAEI